VGTLPFECVVHQVRADAYIPNYRQGCELACFTDG
jgi:hypothetical protein